jgi:hypothetical protein
VKSAIPHEKATFVDERTITCERVTSGLRARTSLLNLLTYILTHAGGLKAW